MYIATPINGRKGNNINEKLAEAEHRVEVLKQVLSADPDFMEYELFSTFDLPHDPQDFSEARRMGDCITAVLNCDAIYLDHGWLQSKGCNLEYRAAKIYGKDIYEHDKL
jgi:hypothetical protein